ncbi:MAG TPA: family 43 glycosylhydrolase [Gallicola sp.]|nr:family 43 glycosylhydrolase [Gallicola sp.]
MRKLQFLLVLCIFLALTGCRQSGANDNDVSYNNYIDEKFDSTIFYKNYGDIIGADPSVITVGDEYYLYFTNSDGSDCTFIQGYKSKDLMNWEWLGRVFVPNRDAWAITSLWAPEVIEKDGKFYMYYSGFDINYQVMGIGLAVADSPMGPFKEYCGTLEDGTIIDHTNSPFNYVLKEYKSNFKAIDPAVFIDDDGKIYLYLSQDQVDNESSVYGMELSSDMVSIKKDTITGPLVYVSQSWESPSSTHRWNEAPFVFKQNGKYYMTYSANYYASSLYAIGYAVSDSPLGEYQKPDDNPLLQATEDWPFLSGPGHCSIFPSADGTELFMAYHSHIDVGEAGDIRKINFDRVTIKDGELIVNGPSISPQLLPGGSSLYKNISSLATVDASDYDASLLVDGVINSLYSKTDTREVLFDEKTTIKFQFDSDVNIKAILVYDSSDYLLSANSYQLSFSNYKVGDVSFNSSYKYVDEFGYEIKIPTTASIIQFENLTTNSVTFTFDAGVAISEIIIVGGAK